MRSWPSRRGSPPEPGARRGIGRLRVRSMRGCDVGAVAALDAAALVVNHRFVPLISADRVDRWTARRYWARRRYRRDRPTFVAVGRAGVLGAVSVDLNEARNRHLPIRRWVYVHSLFVLPGARRRGVARALVRHALRWGRRRGAGGAELGMAAGNRGARALYESFGFRLQEVAMARDLRKSWP